MRQRFARSKIGKRRLAGPGLGLAQKQLRILWRIYPYPGPTALELRIGDGLLLLILILILISNCFLRLRLRLRLRTRWWWENARLNSMAVYPGPLLSDGRGRIVLRRSAYPTALEVARDGSGCSLSRRTGEGHLPAATAAAQAGGEGRFVRNAPLLQNSVYVPD